MTYLRLPYDEASSTTEMSHDCRAAGYALARAVVRRPPSLRYEDQPRELAKPTITVSEAARRLAAAFDRD